MAVEDQVHELLHSVTPYPPIGLDGATVARSARRRHRRRVALVTLPAVVVTALVLAGTAILGQSDRQRSELPADQAPSWQRIPDMPLSPRWHPLVAWTGQEAIVIGGLDAPTVGPGEPSATNLRDGAAYDPEARTWRGIAPAPEDLSAVDASVLVGDTLVVAHVDDLLAYDLDRDSWRRLPDPPRKVPFPTMATQDGLVYVNHANGAGIPVQVLDPATGSWSALPPDPGLTPEYSLRTLVSTPAGLVVLGDGSTVASAELWDGTRWTQYPRTDLRGGFWHWTGERVISGYVATKGESASAALDPATGTWTALPWLPLDSPTTLWSNTLPPADGPLVFSNSWVYDDGSRTFTHVDPPEAYLTKPGLLIGGRTLFTFGGYIPPAGHEHDRVQEVQSTSHAWEITFPDQD